MASECIVEKYEIEEEAACLVTLQPLSFLYFPGGSFTVDILGSGVLLIKGFSIICTIC